MISALSVLTFSAEAQKKAKLSKADKEFLAKQADGIYAKLETTRGDIYTQLEFKQVPMTVANFVGLSEGTIKNSAKGAGVPYYDGIKFHRVIPGFMIQGGDPMGTGGGDPGYSFEDEFLPNSELAKNGYKRGVMAMANRGPNTNGSQFFLMHADYGLPYSYTIFGHIVKGIEVVDSIATAPKNGGDMPNVDQTIKHVTILRKGKEAEAFDAAKVFETERAAAPAKAAARIKAEEEAAKAKQAGAAAEATKILNEKYSSAQVTASGLRTMIEKTGEGAAIKQADKVVLHCTGTLIDGTKFWSSYDGEGKPLEVSLGVSPRLIPGMEEGIMLLKQGGKAKLIIPPNIGYGERGQPPVIPGNSWLVFDVEVLKVN
ncbi:peptidylprolyl isomerase [Sphingobacteriaceae bacterium]|nr:peptidylprolyl isomerase [Sphingobacteriaceae bacterium]